MINIKHFGDITKINGAEVPKVDIITGGSPCQDLSIAGNRAGLAGERSGLFMEQIRLVKEMRDAWEKRRSDGRADEHIRLCRYMVWENVCGAFSSNGGEDFRAVLEETAKVKDKNASIPRPSGKWGNAGCILGDGWSIAWRTHDAQYWGVPQRRKRICMVADFDGDTAGKILFDVQLRGETEYTEYFQTFSGVGDKSESKVQSVSASVHGNNEQSNEERERTAGCAENSAGASSYTLKIRGGSEVDRYGKKAGKGALVQTELSATLGVSQDQTLITKLCYENHSQDSRYKDLGETCETVSAKYGTGGNNQPLVVEPILLESNQNHATVQTNGISTALPASMGEGGGYVPMVVETSKSNDDRMCYRKLAHPQNSEQAQRWGETEVNDTLNIFDNGEKRTPTLIIEPVCVGNSQVAQTKMMETVGTLNCMHDQQAIMCIGNGQIHDAMSPSIDVSKTLNCMDDPMKVMTPHTHQNTEQGWWNESDIGATVRTSCGVDAVKANLTSYGSVVRRLTPLECERLQGYPDGWTDIGEWVDSKGKKHKDADSPRYKALGNSIALPFWQWMAKRMVGYLREDGVTEPKMASLFDGIGGFPLVYSRCGCKPIWASEIEEFPIAVTKVRFPEE